MEFFRGKINSSKTFGGCFIFFHSFSQGAASHDKFLAFRDVIADVLIRTFALVKIRLATLARIVAALSRSFNKGIDIAIKVLNSLLVTKYLRLRCTSVIGC